MECPREPTTTRSTAKEKASMSLHVLEHTATGLTSSWLRWMGTKTRLERFSDFLISTKDGILTREEMTEIADKLSALSNAPKTEAEVTRREWTKWCDFLFPKGQITEDDFVARDKMLEKNGVKVKEKDDKCYNNVFDRMDSNKDGLISAEELRLYYEAFGYGQDYDIEKIFRCLDENHDGLISREEFVKAAVNYWARDTGYDVPRK